MTLREKICLITNCGELQDAPDAAEFQRQGAVLVLQAVGLARAAEELDRHGVDLDGGAAGVPVRPIGADFGGLGVAAREIDRVVEDTGRLNISAAGEIAPYRGPKRAHKSARREQERAAAQVAK